MEVHVLRLRPGEDLRASLDAYADAHGLEAVIVLTCVGSLRRAAIRLADGERARIEERPFEIVSLVGTLSSTGGSHLHIALSDSEGATIGGHLLEGSLIYTTAEIAIGALPRLRFVRRPCPESGYDELEVEPRRS